MIHLHPHLYVECILTIVMSFMPGDIFYMHYIHSGCSEPTSIAEIV